MKTSRFTAGASRFAHFAGLSRKAANTAADNQQDDDKDGKRSRRADDGDDDDQDKDGKRSRRADEGDDDKDGKRSRRADDGDEGDDQDRDGKRSRRADEGDDDDQDKDGKRSRRADEGDDDDDQDKDGKRSRRADDGDDDDDDKDEMSGSSKAASARRRERARCAAIFAHKSAANNIPLAASLAFETTMTRQEAIAVLKGQAGRSTEAPARNSRQSRNVDLGAHDAPGGSKPKAGSSWDRSFARVGAIPRKA